MNTVEDFQYYMQKVLSALAVPKEMLAGDPTYGQPMLERVWRTLLQQEVLQKATEAVYQQYLAPSRLLRTTLRQRPKKPTRRRNETPRAFKRRMRHYNKRVKKCDRQLRFIKLLEGVKWDFTQPLLSSTTP